MAKRDYTKGSISYGFVPLPKDIIQSPEWQALPPSAVKLAIDLMGQYTGKNNGRLCPSFVAMEKSGWTSKHTLIAAKRALLDCSFVVLARLGHAPRTADWIAFTWWKLDFEKSMDIDPAKFPYLNFVKMGHANIGKDQKLHSVVQKLHLEHQKKASGGAETAPQGMFS
ncbi:hypothetical protein ACXX82_19545 [Glaciimonas sp. GNP009]